MPTTPRGITYPASAGHTRIWEHLETIAETIDDALGWRIRVQRVAAQSLPSSATTNVSWDTVLEDSTGAVVTPSTGIVVPHTRTYDLGVRLSFDSSSSVGGLLHLVVLRNGENAEMIYRGTPTTPSNPLVVTGRASVACNAGDSLGLAVFHTAGAGRALYGGGGQYPTELNVT